MIPSDPVRKILLQEFGGPEVLQVREHNRPEVPRDGYLIEVKAIGINFAETVERRGAYKRNQALPYEIGKEAAGVIVERGPEAVEFAVGDPVIAVKFNNGCYSELIPAKADQVLPPPAEYSFEEMAAFANTFGTAWYAMHEIARARPGEAALIQAAAGGVGSAAVLLAKSFGCHPVLGTAGGAQKCAWVEQLGADACSDYRTQDFREMVREATSGRGVDYCLESVGGEAYERSLEALAPMGRLVIIGFSSIRENYAEAIPRLHPLTVFHRSISVGGLNVDNLKYQARRGIWRKLVDHVEATGIKPRIGQVFSLEDAPAAHRAMESRQTLGKVLLVP